MRFSHLVAASVSLLLPLAATAQDAPPPPEPAADGAVPAEAPPPPEATTAFKQDKPCMEKVSDELIYSFGEVTAWPDDGVEMYTPSGVEILGHPVAYVLVKHGGDGGKIDELDYRLQGMQRKVGTPHDSELLKAFDKEFKGADCAKATQSTCGVIYKADQPFTGAEIGSGEIDVGRSAKGPKLAMVNADYNLSDADPVFLACFYRGK
ncbi:hypothetical protein GRI89_10320 [Altererythrobacter salegens]|uniref:Uncharacterized protein n=1 Tax=Croceibacterium salegens TaxID=1737568 RepID=A0A6I4SUV8_9SPHN|nr:hypothetical protein [Croceibacterium salegens]MXO59934.1 hypothetical protein [Croceibacterium salegens]